RFMKYLINRGLIKDEGRKVWAFLGDGEMDEPESMGAIGLAARENLDNLIFVINCNLQRLDGPVRGNGKIIQELEGGFRGSGWNVLKVIWGSYWDPLLKADKTGLLMKRMNECVDGEYQAMKAKGGAYVREKFFGKYPELTKLVSSMTDNDIWKLNRGGHDPHKVYAAYHAAMNNKGSPSVIIAKTVKGYGMGKAGESVNTTHQKKKLDVEDLLYYRDRFEVPLTDEQVKNVEYYKPDENSEEIKYLKERRRQLGGFIPERSSFAVPIKTPPADIFESFMKSTGDKEMSTTMALVRMLTNLLRDKNVAPKLVPIIPDEARTFGMEGFFKKIGIYAHEGQKYEPEDSEQLSSYKETKSGQVLEEGLTEAGAMSSWIAGGTAYANHDIEMIPVYIFYSMFGFQRIGDFAWAAGDAQARGFLIGATAGRTTLAGEGLQHQDGHSHILASTIPNCVSYDPTFAYEMAVIFQDGLKRMHEKNENVFYYITAMNENYPHPEKPEGSDEGILKGMYLFKEYKNKGKIKIQLLGSGTILREAIAAAKILSEEYGVDSDIWSVTSFNELRKDGMEVERRNLLNPSKEKEKTYIEKCLDKRDGPVIAVSDYIRSFTDQIRPYTGKPFYSLGTDGFGRSDTRKQLRKFFEVDKEHIVAYALSALAKEQLMGSDSAEKAIKKYNIDKNKAFPTKL
ncbi:MAG: pyruvate dehydrogenase (acetyl-transferring), homodimeric type, partial [Pelagibacteraceae bacterium]